MAQMGWHHTELPYRADGVDDAPVVGDLALSSTRTMYMASMSKSFPVAGAPGMNPAWSVPRQVALMATRSPAATVS